MRRALISLPPRRVFVQITDRCEAACGHCGFDCQPDNKGELSSTLLYAFLDSFTRRWGQPSHLALTGGEPMLLPERCLEIAKQVSGRGTLVRLVTSGSWARDEHGANKGLVALRDAGVCGLWLSAGHFIWRNVDEGHTRRVVRAAARACVPSYLNFTYLRPRKLGMRGKGRVPVDDRISADVETAAAHRRWAELLPEGGHGWARIWDEGRAQSVIGGLGSELARLIRMELGKARASGKGGLDDLLGLGLDGSVFCGHQHVGFAQTAAEFDEIFSVIHSSIRLRQRVD